MNGTISRREAKTRTELTYKCGHKGEQVNANPAREYPRFIDGKRRAPPKDVGSTSGVEEFLEAMAKPRHPQHREFVRWYGGRFDPDDIGICLINDRVAKLARRRTLGNAGFAKSPNRQH